MQVSYYMEKKHIDEPYEKYIIIEMHQGLQEVQRVARMHHIFNDSRIKYRFDVQTQTTRTTIPLFLADYSGFGTDVFRLAQSEAQGFRADA